MGPVRTDEDWIVRESLAPLRRDFSLEDLRPTASAVGVTATVLVQTVAVAGETPEFLALAAADDRVVQAASELTAGLSAGERAAVGGTAIRAYGGLETVDAR